jgi:hypothetical protein
VIEALPQVIGWHQSGLVPLGERLTNDPRNRLLQADFFAAAGSANGFDPDKPGRKFHAILLDIDHSPRNLLHADNAPFYQREGLRALSAHLLPGGVFALWSDDQPDPEFLEKLGSVFATVRAHVVTFDNPILEDKSNSTVYVACLDGTEK